MLRYLMGRAEVWPFQAAIGCVFGIYILVNIFLGARLNRLACKGQLGPMLGSGTTFTMLLFAPLSGPALWLGLTLSRITRRIAQWK